MQEITIPTTGQGLGGYESAGTVSALAVQVFDSQGNTLSAPNGVLEVRVTGGTVQSTVSFSGTVQTDIADMKIKDVNGYYAEIPFANDAKTGASHTLLVQHIDETGAALRQSTQQAIMNNQGTNATDTTLRSVRDGVARVFNNQGTNATEVTLERVSSSLTVILNNQGTQTPESLATLEATAARQANTATVALNEMGTVATSANQVTSNSFLLTLATGQTSQATAANQTTGNSTLTTIASEIATSNDTLSQILSAQGTQATAAVVAPLTAIMNNQGTQATAALQTTAIAGVAAIVNNQGTQATAAGQVTANATMAAVMNNQGTQATAAGQTAGNSSLAVIVNNQGTQATVANQLVANDTLSKLYNSQGTASVAILLPPLTAIMNTQGTQATAANQVASNSALAVIMNTQGTQATAANQVTQNATMAVVMNTQGTQATAANQVTQNAYLLTLATNQPLVATAANQVLQIQQTASTIRTYGASGTLPSSVNSTIIGLDPSAASTDAFGRLRVSTPDYRFDGQLTYDIPPDLWDLAYSATGTVTYDPIDRMAHINCSAAGTAVMQGHKYAPYTPGRSQLALLTFTLGATPLFGTSRRVGYYDGTNGIYLEHTPYALNLVLASSTSNGNQVVPQSSWNIDKLNGTGPSGLVFNPSKVQIMAISLQALYAGRVVVGFDINGILWPVHQFVHANVIEIAYIANASLPVHFESISTGSNAIDLHGLCASVMSEGGGPLPEIPGRTFSIGSATTIAVTTRRPVLSIRAKQFFNSISNNAIILPNTVSVTAASASVYLEIVRNATLTGAAWTNVDANSVTEQDVAATALTGGSVVFSTNVNASGGGGGVPGGVQLPINANLLDRLVITYSKLLSSADSLTLVVTSYGASTAVGSALVWKEIR